VTVSFLCRQPTCFFYGMNDQWIKHIESDRYRCPQCGVLYQPWTQKKGEYAAQKVLSFTDLESKKVFQIPCKWPQNEEDGWLNKQAEIHARDIKTEEDLDNFTRKSVVSLSDLLERVAVPVTFEKLEWNPAIEHMLHEYTFPESQWRHLKENGFWGSKLNVNPDKAKEEVFDNWPELIGLMANILVAGTRYASRL
jgi:hypothetical protein